MLGPLIDFSYTYNKYRRRARGLIGNSQSSSSNRRFMARLFEKSGASWREEIHGEILRGEKSFKKRLFEERRASWRKELCGETILGERSKS
jgi:hypothetical protein